MASKKLKNAAKIAAGLGAAYALSKMGKGTMDGTEGDFPSTAPTKELRPRAASIVKGAMDGTEGEMTAIAKPQRGSVDAFRQAESDRQSRIAAMRSGQTMGPDRSAFNAKVKAFNEARSGMKNPRYKKGGSVHVKTKLGYSKATKIY